MTSFRFPLVFGLFVGVAAATGLLLTFDARSAEAQEQPSTVASSAEEASASAAPDVAAATGKVYVVLTAREGADPERFEALLEAEEKATWDLYRRGVLREMYLLDGQAGALLVFEAEGADQTRQHLQSLPLVAEDLLDVQVLPVRPFVNLQLLFKERHQTDSE
jgi:muconolactone delta-isomerase